MAAEITELESLEHAINAVASGMSAGFMVLGAAALVAGFWLRKLNRKARVGAGILSIIGISVFCVGTLVSAYILLSALRSQKPYYVRQ
jgi:hypothetical protein